MAVSPVRELIVVYRGNNVGAAPDGSRKASDARKELDGSQPPLANR